MDLKDFQNFRIPKTLSPPKKQRVITDPCGTPVASVDTDER